MKRVPKRIKPLPCPFCGDPAHVVSEHPSTTAFPHRTQCTGCGARTANYKLPVTAVVQWNRRRHDRRTCPHEQALARNR